MSSRERVAAALAGEPVDRPPVSLWRHFYDRESTAEGLAEAMLGFQADYDWDFMKVNPRAGYHGEGWGARFHYTGAPHASPTPTYFPIGFWQDWGRLEPLSPLQGTLGDHLQALRLIAQGLQGRVPFVMTVFTPLAIAAQMVESEEAMLRYIQEHPQEVRGALEVIAESYHAFAAECLNAGASGIFLATTAWASRNLLTEEQYALFGAPYDLRVLEAASGAEFNILHVCQGSNMLSALSHYPVHAFNWDARDPTNPTLKEGRRLTGRAVIGGVDGRLLRDGRPQEVAAQVRDSLAQTGGRAVMIGPGCTFSPRAPEANLRAVLEAVRG